MRNEVSYNARHRDNVLRGYAFEDFVSDFLEYYKVNAIRDYVFEELGESRRFPEADFYFDNVIVEVKSYSKKEFNFSNLRMTLDRIKDTYPKEFLENKVLLIIVGNIVDFEIKERYFSRYQEIGNIEIIDVRNLFYLVRHNDLLRKQLTSLLNFSTEDEEMLPPKFDNDNLKKIFDDSKVAVHKSNLNSQYISDLESWVPNGRENFLEFEELCFNVLKQLLDENLLIWDSQRTSNGRMYRFDLICKIKSESQHDFWNILKHHFETRYVIFEFKNYRDKITQNEIYTTEKYLYAKVLRSVAIMISPNGENENAAKAIRGTLRENGKLILSLSIEDLINMLKIENSENGSKPSDYLSEKLDELLIDLEK